MGDKNGAIFQEVVTKCCKEPSSEWFLNNTRQTFLFAFDQFTPLKDISLLSSTYMLMKGRYVCSELKWPVSTGASSLFWGDLCFIFLLFLSFDLLSFHVLAYLVILLAQDLSFMVVEWVNTFSHDQVHWGTKNQIHQTAVLIDKGSSILCEVM